MFRLWIPICLATMTTIGSHGHHAAAGPPVLRGRIVDADTKKPLAARVYILAHDGKWYFPRSASPDGSAVPYYRTHGQSVEAHTTVSPHPFVADVPKGTYLVTVERGKEYHRVVRPVEIKDADMELTIELTRWVDMAGRGWYSGDTHVHRTADELRNVMLAEDVNVTFPLQSWVTEAFRAPATNPSDRQPRAPIQLDATHVIAPRNTEYEIFRVDKKGHTLGAVIVLGHRTPFGVGVPPVRPVAEQAHREGALLDLDKHIWPWSMVLVPVMNVDLFELANNHVWRTEFGFRSYGAKPPAYMHVEHDARGMTEWGWIDYGFQTYYALLNCGFRLRPSAGTASGVHPVPLGFGRVYAHVEGPFSLEAWMKALDAGRSFVTTGPMLFVRLDGKEAGARLDVESLPAEPFHVTGEVLSAEPLDRIDIIVNGAVEATIEPGNDKTQHDAYRSPIRERIDVHATTWIAVRCFERLDDGRVRFAHSSPFHVVVKDHPLRPRKVEVEYLIERVEEELERSKGLLPEAAIKEYQEALEVYQKLRETAR